MPYPICNRRKDDGVLCGSPALRGKKLCFYHQRDHDRQKYLDLCSLRSDPLRPGAPPPKNLPALQVKLSEVMYALADDRISFRRAGKLLFALQQQSAFLRQPTEGAE